MKRLLLNTTAGLLVVVVVICVAASYAESKNLTESGFAQSLRVVIEGHSDEANALCLSPGSNLKQGFTMTVENSDCNCWLFVRLTVSDNSYFDILEGDTVRVRDTLAQDDLEQMASSGQYPDIRCEAFAVIANSFSANEAWSLVDHE